MRYILLLLLPFNVYGFELGIEQGETYYFKANPLYYQSAKFGSVYLRYGDTVFVEGIQGTWFGDTNDSFRGASVGYRTKGTWFAEISHGAVKTYLNSPQLDGPKQYLTSVGVGMRYNNLILSYRYRHLSNGKSNGRNHGIEFRSLSVAVVF